MGTDYKLLFYNAAGTLQAEVTDFIDLEYYKKVNAAGTLTTNLSASHYVSQNIADKWQVEVYRRNVDYGLDWYADFAALFREDEQRGSGDIGMTKLFCQGIVSMLGWRCVMWPSGVSNRSTFTSTVAETVMKTLVDYNCTSNASTGNGRARAGTITGVSVEADGANGNSIDWSCHGKNLLETLQGIARIGGGDFDLIKTGAQAFEFRWYTGQRGTDRTASVIFSLAYDNMGNPFFAQRRLGEKTVAVVWGRGQGSLRDYVVRTGDNYDVDDNNIELYVDARDIAKGDTAALQDRGDAKLDEVTAVDEFSFTVQQTAQSAYGLHYFVGDLVSVVSSFSGVAQDQKFLAAKVKVNQAGEDIVAEFENA